MPHVISIAGRSDVGRIRRRNEDFFVVLPAAGIAVVADGMGGHPGGDVASGIAAETVADVLQGVVRPYNLGDGPVETPFVERLRRAMEDAILEAHEKIRERGRVEPGLEGMGTTLTAMAVRGESGAWVIGHVGDSRAYRLRGGSLVQLTRDDTWVQEQIDRGEMQPDRARLSSFAHLLTQCLGLEDPPEPQVLDGQGERSDVYVLCTDGLVGMLDDDRLAEILGARGSAASEPSEPGAESPGAASLEALLEAANEAGGHDNITAALIRFG